HFLQILSCFWRQMLVDGHQVVRFPSRLREPPRQELVERLQVLQSPVLSRSHFAEIPTEVDKSGVPLCLFLPFPGQDLVDSRQNEEGSLAIEFRWHRRIPSK